MKVSTAKTVRFAVVVKECGQPQPVFLWTKPEQNPDLMSAIRHNRVMTVKQETKGTRKDFGVVGFVHEKNVSYLVFPKPLNRFKGIRIIGLKYDLIKEPGPIGRVVGPAARVKKGAPRRHLMDASLGAERGRPTKTGPRTAAEKKFRVTVRFTSSGEVTDEFAAPSVAAARERALQTLQAPDFSRATVTKKVVRTQTVRQ